MYSIWLAALLELCALRVQLLFPKTKYKSKERDAHDDVDHQEEDGHVPVQLGCLCFIRLGAGRFIVLGWLIRPHKLKDERFFKYLRTNKLKCERVFNMSTPFYLCSSIRSSIVNLVSWVFLLENEFVLYSEENVYVWHSNMYDIWALILSSCTLFTVYSNRIMLRHPTAFQVITTRVREGGPKEHKAKQKWPRETHLVTYVPGICTLSDLSRSLHRHSSVAQGHLNIFRSFCKIIATGPRIFKLPVWIP